MLPPRSDPAALLGGSESSAVLGTFTGRRAARAPQAVRPGLAPPAAHRFPRSPRLGHPVPVRRHWGRRSRSTWSRSSLVVWLLLEPRGPGPTWAGRLVPFPHPPRESMGALVGPHLRGGPWAPLTVEPRARTAAAQETPRFMPAGGGPLAVPQPWNSVPRPCLGAALPNLLAFKSRASCSPGSSMGCVSPALSRGASAWLETRQPTKKRVSLGRN